mgnify:CR=1 FL=1
MQPKFNINSKRFVIKAIEFWKKLPTYARKPIKF